MSQTDKRTDDLSQASPSTLKSLDNTDLRKKIYKVFRELGVPSADSGGMEKPYVIDGANEILAHINTTLTQTLDQISEELEGEKVRYDEKTVPKYLKPQGNETWAEALRHEQGVNQGLDTALTIIKRARKGL